jgi:hypothetical protein
MTVSSTSLIELRSSSTAPISIPLPRRSASISIISGFSRNFRAAAHWCAHFTTPRSLKIRSSRQFGRCLIGTITTASPLLPSPPIAFKMPVQGLLRAASLRSNHLHRRNGKSPFREYAFCDGRKFHPTFLTTRNFSRMFQLRSRHLHMFPGLSVDSHGLSFERTTPPCCNPRAAGLRNGADPAGRPLYDVQAG